MLNDLGVHKIRLITNNPRKIAGLRGYGIEVVDRVPLLIEANDYNSVYLATKAKKLGHLLLQTYLATVALHLRQPSLSLDERSQFIKDLQDLAREHHLLLQEETRPVTVALFGPSALTFHLGFDQANLAQVDWYENLDHPYVKALVQILDRLSTWGGDSPLWNFSFLTVKTL